jgi:hypothetical protein
VYFRKILLYGAEIWTCTKREIQAIEMEFLRAIMGKIKRDRIRNAHMREELRMEDVQNQTAINRLRWFGHVIRMNEHKMPKRVLQVKMSGKRHKVRPQTQWLHKVKRDIERRGFSWRIVEEVQEWTDRDSRKLLCKSQLTRMEMT